MTVKMLNTSFDPFGLLLFDDDFGHPESVAAFTTKTTVNKTVEKRP
jgi:hypothetical protein